MIGTLTEEALKHCTADDEDPFLLSFHPLDDLISSVSQSRPRGVRSSNTIEFELRCERNPTASRSAHSPSPPPARPRPCTKLALQDLPSAPQKEPSPELGSRRSRPTYAGSSSVGWQCDARDQARLLNAAVPGTVGVRCYAADDRYGAEKPRQP